MRALLISDLHAHNHEQFATTTSEGRNSRFQAILDVLEQVRVIARHHADVIFFLGDMFHSRTKVDVDVFSATWLAWKRITEEVERIWFLVGNHDQYNKVGSIHSLEAFRDLGTVIDQPVIERFGDLTFAAHPFTTNMKQWHAFVRIIPPVDLFLFHQGLNVATTGAFNITVKAEVSYADMPLDRAGFCWGGHYHKPQELGEEKRIGYIGSPLQHSFGERDEEKSVVLYDSTTRKFTRRSTQAPRFIFYEDSKVFFDDVARDAGDPQAPWNRGDYIRVRVEEQRDADAINDGFQGIQVEMVAAEELEEHRVSTDVVSSDRRLLEEYVKKNAKKLDPDRLLSFGMEMLLGDTM